MIHCDCGYKASGFSDIVSHRHLEGEMKYCPYCRCVLGADGEHTAWIPETGPVRIEPCDLWTRDIWPLTATPVNDWFRDRVSAEFIYEDPEVTPERVLTFDELADKGDLMLRKK